MDIDLGVESCDVALKEWAVTCHALREGRQILLLRKGGILDDEGVFQLEHEVFWLQPTYEHQSEELIKPAQRDLFETVQAEREAGENRKFITLRWLAKAHKIWPLTLEDEDKLRQVEHIWSSTYLDLRFNYKPDHPLLCVALRVYERPEPYRIAMRAAFSGCRSWIDLGELLDCRNLRPVLDETTFASQLRDLTNILGP
ncbi:MAG: DUF1802 family protein [Abitibacteriaceae bacterium]|nr:DUF1802 family protein [Abditibacteriaceae bacterium]